MTDKNYPILARPQIHFAPKKGWINDPNGLVYFRGEYHLFYQHHPASLIWGPMHWGHAVSTDLVHWTELDIALAPDQQGACFSGSALVDRNNCSGLFADRAGLVAFYTTHQEKEGFDKGYIQQQCIAYSDDCGRSWIKYSDNPVISSPGSSDFRDPKVIWHEASGCWIQALAVGQEIHFYRSNNLLDWEFSSAFGQGQGAHTEGPWECPDLFELSIDSGDESRWVLVVGIGPSGDDFGSFTQYFVGHFDGYHFHNQNPANTVLKMDEGRDFYAAQTWSDVPQNRRLAIAWMNNWNYANQFPATEYRGNMTLVRELSLRYTPSGVRLVQAFAAPPPPVPQQTSIDLSEGRYIAEGKCGPRVGSLNLCLTPGACLTLGFFGPDPDLCIDRLEDCIRFTLLREGNSDDAEFNREFGHKYDVAVPVSETVDIVWATDLNNLEVLIDNGTISLTQLVLAQSAGAPLCLKLESGEVSIQGYAEELIRP